MLSDFRKHFKWFTSTSTICLLIVYSNFINDGGALPYHLWVGQQIWLTLLLQKLKQPKGRYGEQVVMENFNTQLTSLYSNEGICMLSIIFPIRTVKQVCEVHLVAGRQGIWSSALLARSNSTMYRIQENKTELNASSGDCSIFMPVGRNVGVPISSVFLLINFAVGIPLNLWVVWLICKGTTKMLSSELYNLSLAVSELTYCLVLPIQLLCTFASEEDMQRHAVWIFQPHRTFFSVLFKLLIGMVWMARPIFQCSICVERYTAVVHPHLYLR